MAKHKPVTHVAMNFRNPGLGVICGAVEYDAVTLSVMAVNCEACKRRVKAVAAMSWPAIAGGK